MALFQKRVLDKELKAFSEANKAIIEKRWQTFQQNFLDPSKQANIRASKEEQYQEGFLRELFCDCLGYTIAPSKDYNLISELKNEKGSKKADGAIILDQEVRAVIELKGTDTSDLNKVEAQAFGYKNNQKNCPYVIISNFEKLRFYIDNAIEFLEFNLFTLSEEDFALLNLCISLDSLSKNLPKAIKTSSMSEEDFITKQLYKDYSLFKRELFANLCELNPQYDKLLLFKKTQKLLDRLLFIFFSEDKSLLPPNSIRKILEQWDKLNELDAYTPLYERFKKYFGYMNTGFKGKEYEVFAYNGGLFKPDEVLDNVLINDQILYKYTKQISEYDFDSDVDVNILGHIFENSLSEIEEVQEAIRNGELGIENSELKPYETELSVVEPVEAKRKKSSLNISKRKKDGVFYTPKYITKYIVEQTIGKLCQAKKSELEINEEDYCEERRRQKKTSDRLIQKLQDYRNWLLELTICDPACGSGAFLNEALNFLIAEHKLLDELEAKLLDSPLVFSNIECSILENNLFGVDINEESVEIAKLSLWLRTAQPNRKLNNLNNNIKCGNSLIDDPKFDKAFDWEKEFPQVFARGGFDVIIGNPPYVRIQGLQEGYSELITYYNEFYKSATGNYDIYALFMERSLDLIKTEGIVSFILPHKFLITDFGIGVRTLFKEQTAVESLVHFGSELVFADASTYTCIINLTKSKKERLNFVKIKPSELFDFVEWDYMLYDNLSSDNWDLQSQRTFDLISKLKTQPYTIADVFDKIRQGIASGKDEFFTLELLEDYGKTALFYSKIEKGSIVLEKEMLKPIVVGREISHYKVLDPKLYTIFPYIVDLSNDNKSTAMSFEYIDNQYPLVAQYYKRNNEILRSREKRRFDNDKEWFLFSRPQGISNMEFPKIMTQEISLGCNMTYDTEGTFYHPTTIYSFIKNPKFEIDDRFYLSILNSKLMWFFIKNTSTELRGGYFRFKTNYMKPFPLPEIPNNAKDFIALADRMLSLNKDLQVLVQRGQGFLMREFGVDKLSKKLEAWQELSLDDFIKEIGKVKKKMSLCDKSDWEEYFLVQQEKVQPLLKAIEDTDKTINRMVYDLYALTEEEIRLIEEE